MRALDTDAIPNLTAALKRFHAPMFALERERPGAPFRLLATNKAHDALGGETAAVLIGRTLREILPEDEADMLETACLECSESGGPSLLRDVAWRNGRLRERKTLLQCPRLLDGRPLIVATLVFDTITSPPVTGYPNPQPSSLHPPRARRPEAARAG